jgi:membrane dipeptidase
VTFAAPTALLPHPTDPSDLAAWADWLRVVPLVDGHNDLPWEMRRVADYDLDATPLDVDQPHLQTDLPRISRGGLGAQFWSVYVSDTMNDGAAVAATLEQIDFVHRLVARYPDRLVLTRTAADVRAAVESGRLACLMGAEGGRQIGGSLAVLRMLARLGVGYLTLTHNHSLDWADSATDVARCGGLSPFGVEVVHELNRLGLLVDLSHVADTTMHAALDASAAPVIFSHSSARAVCDVERNVPDDVLGRLPVNGGVCMVTFVPEFINPAVARWRTEAADAALLEGIPLANHSQYMAFARGYQEQHPKPVATIDDVVAHIEHVRDVAGTAHIGVGGDYDGTDTFPLGMEDVGGYPRLFAALGERGWSSTDLAGLAGGNVLRVLADAGPTA